MKGYFKIVGTNEGCTKLSGLSGEGELVYQNHHNYSFKFEGEDFFLEIKDFIILEKIIEFSGWIGDKDHNFGRIAIQFEPNNES